MSVQKKSLIASRDAAKKAKVASGKSPQAKPAEAVTGTRATARGLNRGINRGLNRGINRGLNRGINRGLNRGVSST